MRCARPIGRWCWAALRGLAGLALVAGAVGGSGTRVGAQPAPPPTAPSGQAMSQEEIAYWVASVPCPPAPAGLQLAGAAYTGNLLPDVSIACRYADPAGDPAQVYEITVEWDKPGNGSARYCNDGDSADRLAVGTNDAVIRIEVPAGGEARKAALATAAAPLRAWAAGVAEPCPQKIPCPTIDGYPDAGDAAYYPREGYVTLFGSSGRTSTLSYAECYLHPESTTTSTPLPSFHVKVYWATEQTTATDRLRPCSIEEQLRDGIGTVRSGDGRAAYGLYAINSKQPVDPAPYEAAARAMVASVSPRALSCAGITPAQQDSPLPAALAAAFAPLAGGAATTVPAPATSAAGTTAPATGPSRTAPATAAATAGPSTDEGTPWTTWLLRALGIVAMVLSVVSLALTFVLVRRETRIRPVLDVVRLAVTLAVAVAMIVIFSLATPATAIAVAVVLGLAVGVWQGTHLAVRRTTRGLFGRRTGWAVVAFGVGIVLAQVAGYLDRTGVIAVGVAVTFLSAAIAAGVILGRRPRLAAARRLTPAAVVLLVVVAGTLAGGRDVAQAQAQGDGVVDPAARSAAQNALIDMVDWTTVGMQAGLFADQGKPFVPVSVPRAFDSVPPPTTVSTTWTRADAYNQQTYSVTETYTFGLRADGRCCTVEYSGKGTTSSNGGQLSSTYEAAGRLDDIQVLALEGEPGAGSADTTTGMPFSEIQAYQAPGTAAAGGILNDVTTCRRAVAQTRFADDLEKTGGQGRLTTYLVDGRSEEPPATTLEVTMGIGCDVPGFTPEAALAVIPPPPAASDPVRVTQCPVFQEVVAALEPANTLAGVDTRTMAKLFLAPNQPACSTSLALGKGGKGETRHELNLDLAQPGEPAFGDGSTLVDGEYWNDLPMPYEVPAESRCATDATGAPVEPTDRSGGCTQVNQQTIGNARVLVWTDWYWADGPNVVVFVDGDFGSYAYRCHHCTPNDPGIAQLLGTLNGFVVDAGARTMAAPTSGRTAPATTSAVTTGQTGEPAAAPAAGTTTTSTSDRAPLASLASLAGALTLLGVSLRERGAAGEAPGEGEPTEGGDAEGGDPRGKWTYDRLNDIKGFQDAYERYRTLGYDGTTSASLAAIEVGGAYTAGESKPLGGVNDARVEMLGGAMLPSGVQSAVIPAKVVENYVRTGVDAVSAVSQTTRTWWASGQLEWGPLDRFVDQVDARGGGDPFSGWSQAFGLAAEELYRDDGQNVLTDLVRLSLTPEDVSGAVLDSAEDFRKEVEAGTHGVVLQGLNDVFDATASLLVDHEATMRTFRADCLQIWRQGVGDGFWTDVGTHVDQTLEKAPVVDVIYKGYKELFGGVASKAQSVDDLTSGRAALRFAGEVVDGGAALAAEGIDLVTGADTAVKAYDYIRSWF